MHPMVRPVGIGLILGLLTFIFGISWAVFLTVHHERIHRYLSERGAVAAQVNAVVDTEPPAVEHSRHEPSAVSAHTLHDTLPNAAMAQMADSSHGFMQYDGLMEKAHERLTRGHIHAMGLGLIASVVSLIMAFLNVPNRIKAAASACVGVGGLFYPFAWIIMGFRTVTLGTEGAEKSVLPIVALSVALVLIGISLTLVHLIKGLLRPD